MKVDRNFCLASLLVLVLSTPCLAQTTISFQQGVDGYQGLLDIYTGIGTIEDKNGEVIDTFFFATLGSDVENAFIDGSCDLPTSSGGDTQAWMRFDESQTVWVNGWNSRLAAIILAA